jgi:hypothetical protein
MDDGTIRQTREQWLNRLARKLRPLFGDAGVPLPDKVRITCGWPSHGGLGISGTMSRVIGECWSPKASRDGHAEIFISPLLDDATGPHGVGATLVHELVHATVGNECGHRGAFKRVAEAVGLEGPMTATHAGGRLRELLGILLLGCGPYPHGRIVDRGMRVPEPEGPRKPGRPKTPEPEDRPADRPPKQGTRNLKVTCPTCGYVCRVTRKWLDIGAPICPTDRESMVEAGQ